MLLPQFPSDAVFKTNLEPPEGTEQWHYRREAWPPGPWHDEPWDIVTWVDEATGYECMLNRGYMGAWCGYVAVPREHPAYGKHYDGIDVSVHGGLTFAGANRYGKEGYYYLGFDCNHCQDLAPGALALSAEMAARDGSLGLWTDHKDYDPVTGISMHGGYLDEAYRDMAYVKTEVESLASQLKEQAGAPHPV